MSWTAEGVMVYQISNLKNSESLMTQFKIHKRINSIGMIFMAVTIFTGVWLMISNWGQQYWISAAIISLTGIVVAGLISKRKFSKISDLLITGSSNEDFVNVKRRIAPVISTVYFKLILGTLIVCLMSIKPNMIGSIVFVLTGWSLAILIFKITSSRYNS